MKGIVDGVDRFLKKTKVRGQGLCKRFGEFSGIFIGSIPVVKEAMIDEFLQENSLKLKRFALMRSRYILLQIETKRPDKQK